MKRRIPASTRAKRAWAALLVFSGTVLGALPAMAAPVTVVEIPIDTVSRGLEGTVLELASVSVPEEFVGLSCTTAAAVNNVSVHPGNDLIVESGNTVVIPNVEGTRGQFTILGDGPLILSDQVTVSVLFGEDETFSAGMTVTVECEEPPPSGWACVDGEVVFIPDATNFEGTLYETEEEAAADPGCVEEPPSGWACVNGEVVFIPDATNFEGTLYETEEEAANDVDCIEVLASTTFTIAGGCDVAGDATTFTISGNLGEGVTLQVAGQTLTETGAFSISVDEPGSYPYVVTLDEGFVLAEGSPPAEATISLEDCTGFIVIQTLGVCENDIPYLYYSVEVFGDVAPGSDTVDIHWFGPDGVEGSDPAHDYTALPLSGSLTGTVLDTSGNVAQQITNANRVLWPGARVNNGAAVDWPGWTFDVDDDSPSQPVYDQTVGIPAGTMLNQNGATGVWEPAPDGEDGFTWARLAGASVTLEVNPEASAEINYPPSTPTCSAAPDEVSDVEVLPFTGAETDFLALIAVVLAATGGAVLFATRKLEEN